MSSYFFLYVGLVGPLVGAAVAAFAGKSLRANTIVQSVFAASSAVGLLASGAFLFQLLNGTSVPVVLGYTGIPFAFLVDPLSSFFLMLIHGGTLMASLFALGYVPKYRYVYSFPSLNAASGLFLFGMQAAVLSHSILGFLLFWEVMSVAAYFLVIADREEASIRAGFLYFVMTHIGFVCLLVGMLVLGNGDPMTTFEYLRAHPVTLSSASLIAFALVFVGFGSKAGLIPLHQWLPEAHPQAPSHSSALLSGVMLKVAVYGFLRVMFSAFPTIPLAWAAAIVCIGLLSAVYGVISASVESDVKRLLAWSSVENLGLIFAMIGTGYVFTALGLSGTPFFLAALFHSLSHTVFKTGLFLSAGAIVSETHTRDMDEMGGLANVWPGFSASFLGLALAAAALPPFSTFYGEWMFLQGLASGMLQATSKTAIFGLGIVLSVTALVGGLAIFTFAKAFVSIFLSRPRTEHVQRVKPLSVHLVWPVTAAAFLSLGIGVFAATIAPSLAPLIGGAASDLSQSSSALRVQDGVIDPFILFFGFVSAVLVVWVFRRFATSQRPIRITETWDCGQPLTARMEYTATGFSAPIRFFFRSILLAEKRVEAERIVATNAWMLRRRVALMTASIWDEWLYQPIGRSMEALAKWVKRLQNGVIQFYILLILATLVLTLVIAV